MKYIYQNFIIILASFLSLVTFNACSDDDESVNEWTANYVYLQKEDYLLPDRMYSLVHSPVGIEGEEVTGTFVVKMKRPATKDVSVILEAQSDEVPNDLISLSTKEIVIKAGETVSEIITLSMSDWNFAQQERDAKIYNLKVVVADIHNAENDLRISELHKVGIVSVEKGEYALVTTVKPDTWQSIERKNWSTDASSVYYGAEDWCGSKMAIDDDISSAWYSDGIEDVWWSATLDTPAKVSGFSIGIGANLAGANFQYKKEGDTEWTTIATDYNFADFKSTPTQYGYFDSVIENVKEIKINLTATEGKYIMYTGFTEFELYVNK